MVTKEQRRNWLPLEGIMQERHGDTGYCSDYMFMGMHGKIYMYKNRDTRRYLLIDDDLNFYENYNKKCSEEKAFMIVNS